MNIGEDFYCSRCLQNLAQEQICNACGYDPSSPVLKNALEEGTLICEKRFQIGAVNKRLKNGFLYGAYDFLKREPVFIFEFFPDNLSERDAVSATRVKIPKDKEEQFRSDCYHLEKGLTHYYEIFPENETFYVLIDRQTLTGNSD